MPGAMTTDGPRPLSDDWKIHHAREGMFLELDADEDSKERNAVDERNGSIDGIDYPPITRR